MTSIRCGNCGSWHESVRAVRDCYSSGARVAPATEPQKRFAFQLTRTREVLKEYADISNDVLETKIGQMSKAEISSYIDKMQRQPERLKVVERRGEVKDGIYQMPDGTIYKVQKAIYGSGNQYAKRLVVTQNGEVSTISFVYEPNGISRIRPEYAISKEEAEKFGRLYGVCVLCGRTLTDENSIAAGIGPICSGKMGW